MTTPRLSMHITMDPYFYLNAAGHPQEQADSIFSAWADAVQQIGAGIGADITTQRVKTIWSRSVDASTETEIGDDESYLEPLVWQMAHDHIALVNGEWRASPPSPDHVERLLATMRRAGLPTPDATEDAS